MEFCLSLIECGTRANCNSTVEVFMGDLPILFVQRWKSHGCFPIWCHLHGVKILRSPSLRPGHLETPQTMSELLVQLVYTRLFQFFCWYDKGCSSDVVVSCSWTLCKCLDLGERQDCRILWFGERGTTINGWTLLVELNQVFEFSPATCNLERYIDERAWYHWVAPQ